MNCEPRNERNVRIDIVNAQSHDLTNQLELALGNAGYSRERVIHYSFLVENALHEWRERLPEDAPLSYARVDTRRDFEFIVELRGERCDPFVASDAERADRLSAPAMVDRLLSGVGKEIRYSYRDGVNRIRIRLPKQDVEDTVFRRNLFVLLLPIAVEYLLETIASSVDALMLSVCDAHAMSAVTLVMGYMQFHGYIIFACVAGSTALISQYWGVRDRESIGKVASLALKVTMLASVVFGVVTCCFPRALMECYTNVPQIVERGVPYVRLVGITFLLAPIYRIHYCCVRALGRPKVSMNFAIVGCVVNIILNAVFIYGLFGAPKLGTLGVGIATVVSAIVQTALSVIDYLRHRDFRIDLRNCPILHNPIGGTFFGNVIPTITQCMVWILGANVISAIVGHMHADMVAASSLLMLVFGMVMCLQMGYGSATGLLIGNLLGKGRFEEARHFGKVVLKLAFKLGLGFAAAFLVIGYLLPCLPVDLNANSAHLVRMMVPFFCINAVFGIMNSAVCQGVLYIGGDAKGLLLMDGIFMWGLLVPFALLGAYVFHMPELALIAVIRNDETLSFPFKMLRYSSYKWLKNLTVKK